jgi:hypothetical protein
MYEVQDQCLDGCPRTDNDCTCAECEQRRAIPYLSTANQTFSELEKPSKRKLADGSGFVIGTVFGILFWLCVWWIF